VAQEEEVKYQCFSPPQFQKRAAARESVIKLEDRLIHFIEWLMQQGFSIAHEDCGELNRSGVDSLVMEYVEG
jgi:hypothetical protein